MPLRERNEIGRVSSPRDLERVSALGEEEICDALGSVVRRDMEGCPSLLVLGIDVGPLSRSARAVESVLSDRLAVWSAVCPFSSRAFTSSAIV